ncbi:hypothetical protein Asppvi_010704 [Aspergillus pseudoviridinutans]|uniref:Ankyrin repeat-containing domain protein n=1 Tax=Aspergillus pseudoviridinutans TaxID=1517512 RepID=A0A9P3EZR0_9EURO|nr:uncharacterized protein Asppvi_010704 [Aspergillus pseudoviridinutans]GIJ91732.1 hypothetical protein Asppvi_010704 [Aspergillus pseudoviridinutans]
MTQLDLLPLELLRHIVKCLSNQRDLNTLLRTNRNLYHLLHVFLCQYNIQHHQSSALLWAARNGDANLIIKLLDAGANIAAFETSNVNPLLLAAQEGHIATLKTMLSETRPGRACSPAQLRSVLHWAIRSHDGDVTELMIENQAPLDPEGVGREALSALGVAVASHYDSIIPRLLKEGARPGPEECPCPLENAIYTDQRQVVELLLKSGIQLESDESLCHIAGQNNQHLLQLLINYGLDIELFGHAALFTAIMHGQYEMVELLIEKGANPHLTYELFARDGEVHRYSSVGFAIYFGHLDILKLLLAKGVHPEKCDLHLAMKKGDKQKVALLSEFSYEGIPEKEDMSTYVKWQLRERCEKNPDFHRMGTRPFLIEPANSEELSGCLHSYITLASNK